MFTFSSFKKVLLGVTVANGGLVASCFYTFKKNRPQNDSKVGEPTETFRMKTFDELATNYDEKNDFIERVTSINKYKKRNFRKVRGVVLEIGAGTGRNFSFLKNIDALVCVEKSEKMCEQLKKKLETLKLSYPVYIINSDIKNSHFKPNIFDSVLSSFTLCSLECVDECLQKVYESLKYDGKFYLIERGIIYNKIVRYILEKMNLYPNRKIPWEYGYYENRNPLEILKKNNFNIIFKLIKNAGSIYILTAKKHASVSSSPNTTFNSSNESNMVENYDSKIKEKTINKPGENQTKQKKYITISDLVYEQSDVPIYYSNVSNA
ncbi:methyltransferase, putative [Plasmodium ovale]|uniref:Methyltransferase, putative n=2 Tax=Plasmodium ovale TaxID=36330 RepID=A0A1A8VKP8_PLAOA|nr:methyltransferase, putative [Plasmodium ovale curtisi]SBS80863.1 methyltransferase, putative [Plasmodium ovale curtisi]SCA48366.1 methyltransferase, putative [Plasmodium ovale]